MILPVSSAAVSLLLNPQLFLHLSDMQGADLHASILFGNPLLNLLIRRCFRSPLEIRC